MKTTSLAAAVIAMVAHEVNRAYCQSLGDASQPSWAAAPEWQQKSALAGVEMHLANPEATPEQSHESWLAQKLADGWKVGPVKDADLKEHPCCVSYAELPAEQKAKDYIFRGVVHALAAIEMPAAPVNVAQARVAAVSGVGVPVQYVGRRDTFTDNLYGSGLTFVRDQVRAVPGALAERLLRHTGMFVAPELAAIAFDEGDKKTAMERLVSHLGLLPAREDVAAAVVEQQEQPRVDDTATLLEASKLQEEQEIAKRADLFALYDQINQMEKPALLAYAKSNYGQDLSTRLGDVKLREQVIGLVDQFGKV